MRGQLGSRSGDGSTLKDSEREAFNAELDRIAAAREEVTLPIICLTNVS